MRILVTGGAGFIGSHLCERLIADGAEVICLDNFFTGRKSNIEHLVTHPHFELVRHDVTEPILLEVDQIYNLACPASPVHYQYNPIKTVKTNVMGTINMLGLAKRVKARILQASTSEVYGDPIEHPQTESYWGNVNPIGLRSCYDEGKRVAETLMMDYHRQSGVDTRIVRIFNTYGTRMLENDGRVVSNFIVQALRGEKLTIYGDGSQTRSFCYVSDLVEGIIRLMNTEARAHRLEKLGVEQLYHLPFDGRLASMTAETFVTDVLVKGLGVSHVTVGADFCFGQGRKGTAETLRAMGASHGFGVTVAELVKFQGLEVSSTNIRSALAEGRPRDAAEMLGHWHRIEGAIIHGEKRGRALGFPTANMAVDGLHLPRLGVYAVKVDVLTGPLAGSYGGAASLGVRPMFGENQPNLETFLFDFAGDLYGHHLSVAFIDYLRPEMKFAGLPGLLEQMATDCLNARAVLATV